MDNKQTNQSSYIIDSSSGAEMARLIDQDRMLTQATGVFPDALDLTEVYRLIDVACGPGGWALEAARQLPDSTIIGADINAEMIRYANAFATVAHLHTLSFQVLDVMHHPLAFADASFDLLHARLLIAVVYKQHWPALLKEYMRLLRPKGWIVLTESDRFITSNSQTIEAFFDLIVQAMLHVGFYAGDAGDGITSQLPTLLQHAGGEVLQTEQYRLDVSYGTLMYDATVSNLTMGLSSVQPFLIKMGYSSPRELEAWYEQAMNDLHQEDFRGYVNLTRVWGRKG